MFKEAFALEGPIYRGEVAARYASPDLRAALLAYKDKMRGPGATVLLDGRNAVVAVSLPLGSGRFLPAVIKEFRVRGFDRLKRIFLPSKAVQAWRGATALLEHGFQTPAPVAYLERRVRGFVAESVFIAERVSDGAEIRTLFRELPEAELRSLLVRLAPVLRRLHDVGLVHRDLSDGNVVVRSPLPGEHEFLFLDTNRIRRRRHVGTFGRARNLVRLGVPSALQAFFMGEYAAAPGASRVGRSFVFWYRVGKGAFGWWIRFKKALRLRKIARTLKIQ
jgi:hypothetical protein